jgi:hypothetical protein
MTTQVGKWESEQVGKLLHLFSPFHRFNLGSAGASPPGFSLWTFEGGP